MYAKIKDDRLISMTNREHNHDRTNFRIMKRFENGAKIKLLDEVPELQQKYQTYLLGPDEPIKKQFKRKYSLSKPKSVPAKKAKRKRVKSESENSEKTVYQLLGSQTLFRRPIFKRRSTKITKSDQIESGCVYANVEAGSSATSSIVMHNARRDPAQQQPLNHHPHSLATLCSGGGKHSFSGPSANDPTSIISATISKGREMLSVATGKSAQSSTTNDSLSVTSSIGGISPTPSASSIHLSMTPGGGPLTGSSSIMADSPSAIGGSSSIDAGDALVGAKDDVNNQLCAYHDCNSLAAGWNLGPPTTSLEAARPTGASQAQSPSEDDPGDGKSNELLASCPAFRNELGIEPTRRLGLSRPSASNTFRWEAADIQNKQYETWHREHTAAEACVLEDVSNVYLGGKLCKDRQPKIVIEPQEIGCYYFRHCFAGRSHINYFGIDDQLGPVVISMVKESSDRKEAGRTSVVTNTLYRLIVRISDLLTMRVAVCEEALSEVTQDKSTRTLMRELLELVCPQVHFGCLKPALANQKVEDLLLKIDEQPIYTRYKVGILFCRAGQSTEEQMYNNEHSSPAFEEFLDFLGQRVRLRGFESYKGGLDTRGNTTGEYSIYTEFHNHEIMFHVSTLLPFTPNNKQQLSRKRHIGNDIEPGALPFSPITVRSHFQHVFIIVRVNNPCTDNVSYGVAVSRAKDVPAFGPPIQRGATYQKSKDFYDFLISKIINAENAVHRSSKFAAMAARTRREALKDLAENYVTAHPNEGPSRIASRFLGGSVKRKERPQPKPCLGASVRGALSWLVEVHDHSFNHRINCVLGLSAESLVLLEMQSGSVLFATPTHSIIGWANTESGLKIYYDHGDMLLLRCCTVDGTDRELSSLLRRLEAVTNGEEAKEILLRRPKPTDSLGFHIQEEGVVVDVEMYQTAWKAGLRQGSRIVEIEGFAVITMSHDQMTSFLERQNVRILMIAPMGDGNPRRGCEDSNCPAVKGQEVQILTPDTFARQPLTYEQIFKIRNKELSTSPHNSPSGSFEERHFIFNAKDFRKDQVGSPDPNGQQKLLKKSSTASTSNLSKSSTTLHHQYSADAEVEEAMRQIDEYKFEFDQQFPDPISKYQWHLQKVIKEKKDLEKQIETMRSQLLTEKRGHDATKKQLEILQRYCEKYAENQPGDEVL